MRATLRMNLRMMLRMNERMDVRNVRNVRMTMRNVRVIVCAAVLAVAGCATGAVPGVEDAAATRMSVARLDAGNDAAGTVIRVQAGIVHLRHTIPSTARLGATTLEGLDPENRHLQYSWDQDGSYIVTVSGRYRHAVRGSIAGGGGQRLTSTLTYTPLPDGSE